MLLYPAIDVLNGRAVRLLYGKRSEAVSYTHLTLPTTERV